ncbi:MAG: hypothetical protein ACFFHV_06295 [Promethearchaeota archaeon]
MVLLKPPIIDGHIDTALEILRQPLKFSECSTISHRDFLFIFTIL